MKLTVNGVEIPNATNGLDVLFEVDPAGESMDQIRIVTSGGVLTVRREGDAAVKIIAERDGCLALHDGTIVADSRQWPLTSHGHAISGDATGDGLIVGGTG